jgi:hypothetical protein
MNIAENWVIFDWRELPPGFVLRLPDDLKAIEV